MIYTFAEVIGFARGARDLVLTQVLDLIEYHKCDRPGCFDCEGSNATLTSLENDVRKLFAKSTSGDEDTL